MFKKILKFTFFVFIGLAILGSIFGVDEDTKTESDTSQKTTAEAPAEEPKVAEALLSSGMYKVGSDIPAGEYMLICDGMAGYYEIDKDSTGSFQSILGNDNFFSNRYVRVTDGEYLKLQGCKLYALDNLPQIDEKEMYKVGVDVSPGEYKIIANGNGYYEVSSAPRVGLKNIISNGNFQGESYITLRDGQYIKFVNANFKLDN